MSTLTETISGRDSRRAQSNRNGKPVPRFLTRLLIQCACFGWLGIHASGASLDSSFKQGLEAYRNGDYETALKTFQEAASHQPASGTLQNLGLAQWQLGKVGYAILTWEKALWLDPFNGSARTNLRFARKAAQVEAPDLSWNEVVSTWLPVNWWAWIAGLSLWVAVGMVTVPPALRLAKAGWHQAFAAFGIMVFLLSVPAHIGVYTRSRLGFVLAKQVPFRLTPTADAESITQLSAGEPVRFLQTRGSFVLVRTSRSLGWIEREQLGRIWQ